MNPSIKLSKDDCPETKEDIEYIKTVPYQSAVGGLMHAAVMTRSDLAFPMHNVAQFMQNPSKAYWHAVQHIIHYAYTTHNNVLTLGEASPKPGAPPLYVYCDTDFANEKDHACSVSGYALFYGNQGAFAWSAKKQTATALSTGEAEYSHHPLFWTCKFDEGV